MVPTRLQSCKGGPVAFKAERKARRRSSETTSNSSDASCSPCSVEPSSQALQ